MVNRGKSHARDAVRIRTGRDPEQLLRELFVEERHSRKAIADALGVERRTISAWLREYGITRDERPPVVLP